MNKEIQKKTNPVSETAEMTLFQLAANGDKDAAAIASKMGLTFEGTQTFGSIRMSDEDMIAFRIVLEVRYQVMKLLAEKSGSRTVVDIPCGYTPLPIALSRIGKQYLGLDLPVVAADAEKIILPMVCEEKRSAVSFMAVDATNDESMEKAFLEVQGNLCILTSGLLMYFSESELEAMARNIKRALEMHGGCWITADPEVNIQHFAILRAISGDHFDRIMQERYDIIGEKSDSMIGDNALSIHFNSWEKDQEAAMNFLKSHGLQAERLIIADHMPEKEPFAFSLVDEPHREAVRKVFKETAFWKITSDGTAGSIEKPVAKAQTFRAKITGGELELKLTGRFDTLSAPKVLEYFEKESVKQEIRKVTIDCSGLIYISSAGLRVLLMMQKKCRDGIALSEVNEPVREILEKTGFNVFT